MKSLRLPGPFTAGFRIDAGMANRDAPGQALYYLGGYKTIRGYPANIASGPSTAILTGELGTDTPLARLVVFGEVGLSGEIRPVPNGQERLAEAAKHGFKRAIVPQGNSPRGDVGGMRVTAVTKLSEALDALD